MSIIFNKATCNLRERKIVGNKFELVMAVGRVGKISRQFAFICVYIEPRTRVGELKELNELINSQILQLRAKGDPVVCIGGDLNHRSLEDALDDFPDVKRINFDPTRGQACLDVLHSNEECTSAVWPPLETREGIPSDHSCVIFNGSIPKVKDFVWLRKTTRKHTAKAVKAFETEMKNADWNRIMPVGMDQDELVSAFEKFTGDSINRLFPLRSIRYRSNEKPWITNGIRRLSNAKKRIYKREGKSALWIQMDQKMASMLAASKEAFVDNVSGAGTSSKSYFSAVKALSTNAAPTEWSITDIMEGKTEEQAGDEAAAFFTKISDEFEPLQASQATPVELRPPMTLEEVKKKLADAKKPNSSVRGDVLPRLMKEHHQLLAVPVQRIFNAVFASGCWPSQWKEETTVVIPKVNNPESLAECRNISCTPFLSKVLESVLLEDLRKEIPVDPLQYGGLKGSSVDHLLLDLLDEVHGALDVGRPAAVLSIDFEKAFNRLNHQECLKQLRELGASQQSLTLIRSFLTGRTMRVKVGSAMSAPRLLKGGSPQGSILGCYLYCAATQQINDKLPPASNRPRGGLQVHQGPDARGRGGEEEDDDEEGFRIEEWHAGLPQEERDDTREDPEEPAWLADGMSGPNSPGLGSGGAAITLKYVDDTTVVEVIPRGQEVRHISSTTPTEYVPTELLEGTLLSMIERAEEIGMKINCAKTQLIIFTPDNGYKASASINTGGGVVLSQEDMKLLGFMIGTTPDASAQVQHMKTKFRKKFWSLIHLRRAGLKEERLFKLYCTMIRPVLETNCVVFGPMLTRGQASDLERLQKLAIRLCFGFDKSYEVILEENRIESLEERRKKAVRKFAAKTIEADGRFARKWLIPRDNVETNLRRRRPYVERRARTERMYKSPLMNLQRVANDIMSGA